MKRPIKVWDTMKYARKDVKINGVAAIIMFVVAVVFVGLTVLCELTIIKDSIWVGVVVLGLPCSIILFFSVILIYLDSKIYIADLDKKGFAVPVSKKDCDYKLSLLIREEQDIQEDTKIQESKIHKRHLVLAIIAGVITVLTAIHSFTLARRPHPLAIFIMLVVTGLMFWQSFNRFFKNDIDIDIEDSRWIRPRIVPAVVGVGICFFIVWAGTQMVNAFPVGNEHYYAQIMRYYKREYGDGYRFYLDRLPSYAKDVRFISWGRACGVSFYVPQENLKDIQAYYEGLGEAYVIHTMEDDGEDFIYLCNRVKEETTYFRSEDYENCMVYEFTEYYIDQWGNSSSWYLIMDTNSGEVGYGYCPTDW